MTNRQSPVQKLASAFEKRGLRARGGEGHSLEDFAIGPYVLIDNDRRKQLWKSRHKVMRALEDYYSQIPVTDFGARLILKRLGRFGSFLIVNQDADTLDLLSQKERSRRLDKHRREFLKASEYLTPNRRP